VNAALVVLRGGGLDGDGYPSGDTTEVELGRCLLFPRRDPGSGEDNDRAEQVIGGLSLFAPAGSDVRATDRVRVPEGPYAGVWDVVGDPGHWVARTAVGRSVVEVALERVTG